MKPVYTNALRMGNKREELEKNVHQENCDTVAIKEIGEMTLMTGVLQ